MHNSDVNAAVANDFSANSSVENPSLPHLPRPRKTPRRARKIASAKARGAAQKIASQQAALREGALQIEQVLANCAAMQILPVPIIVVGRSGRVLFASRTLLEWTGQSEDRVLERDFFEVFALPEERVWLSETFRSLISQNKLPPQFEHRVLCRETQSARTQSEERTQKVPHSSTSKGDAPMAIQSVAIQSVAMQWTITSLQDAAGRVRGVLATGAAAAELQHLRAEVENSREQLALTLEAASMATWSWEVDSETAFSAESRPPVLHDETSDETSDQSLATLSQDEKGDTSFDDAQDDTQDDTQSGETFSSNVPIPHAELNIADFMSCVHAEDFDHVEKSVQSSIESGAPLHLEFRMRRDGAWRWIESKGRVIYDERDRVVRIAGVSLDVTSRYASEEALHNSQVLHDAVITNAAEGVVVYDTQKRFRSWNVFMENMTGFAHDEVLGRRAADVFPHLQTSGVVDSLEKVLTTGDPQRYVSFYCSERTRREMWISGRHAPLRNARNEIIGVIALISDITHQRRAEEQLHQSNAILEATQEASAEGTCLVDDKGRVVRFNKRFAELWNIAPDRTQTPDSMTRVLEELRDPDEFIEHINDLYDNPHKSVRDEIFLKDGRVFDRYSAPATTPNGVSYGRVWSFSDITERVTSQQNLQYQAYHDALTGLPNRALFMERLELGLARSRRNGSHVAVLFLDLDRFKNVNDSLGHKCGDQLLVQVAHRLRTCMRHEDTAARLGGDEFVLLIEDVHEPEEAARIAERIAESLSSPFVVGGHEVFTSTSIGIAFSTKPFADNVTTNILAAAESDAPDDLLRNADAAMYRAKGRGRAGYEIFDHEMNEQAMQHLQLETDLRRAVRHNQFELHYQPIFNLQSQCESGVSVTGVEALLRWNHPQSGVVPPDIFIALAEETGLIVPIGQWVFREACRVARLWQEEFPHDERVVSVNLSARQFAQPDLASYIARVLEESDLQPSRLHLEITESVLMNNAQSTITTLKDLKTIGLDLSVDDFGTGYSSLSYLRRFPVSALKIDRSFVNGLGTSSEDTAIVRAIITLAQTLGLKVVAEGVETRAQLDQLRELGCEYAQGFLFARPMTWTQLNQDWEKFARFPTPVNECKMQN